MSATGRDFRGRRVALVAGSLLTWAAVVAYRPFATTGPVLCGSRLLLGVPCPSCGMTRGLAALSAGDWGAAWGFNPFSLLVGAALVVAPLLAALELGRGRALDPRLTRWLYSPRLAWALALGLGAFHVHRLWELYADGRLAHDFHTLSLVGRLLGGLG